MTSRTASAARDGNPKDVVPHTQQQAQHTLLEYLRERLEALPAGTTFDASRFLGRAAAT